VVKVVDASVLVEFLVGGEHHAAARLVVMSGHWLWAPMLIDAEVGQTLRRKVRRGEISPTEAREAFDRLPGLRLQRIPPDALVERAWQLRENVTFYDALYVALAEALGVPLLTCDQHLARAPGMAGTVELIAPV
jgi:predicted nucleic acid-binding protein